MNVSAAAKALLALNCFPFQQSPPPPPTLQVPMSAQMMAAAMERKAQEDLDAACNSTAKALSEALAADKGCPK